MRALESFVESFVESFESFESLPKVSPKGGAPGATRVLKVSKVSPKVSLKVLKVLKVSLALWETTEQGCVSRVPRQPFGPCWTLTEAPSRPLIRRGRAQGGRVEPGAYGARLRGRPLAGSLWGSSLVSEPSQSFFTFSRSHCHTQPPCGVLSMSVRRRGRAPRRRNNPACRTTTVFADGGGRSPQ